MDPSLTHCWSGNAAAGFGSPFPLTPTKTLKKDPSQQEHTYDHFPQEYQRCMARKWAGSAEFNPGPERTAADFAFVLVGRRGIRPLPPNSKTRTAHRRVARARFAQIDGRSVTTIQHTTNGTPLAVNSSHRAIPLKTPNWMTPKQAAVYLNLSVSWLAKRRVAGDGPTYAKPRGAVRYEEASLQQWMKGQQRTSTSG
jgi:hypothetical protein